MRWVGGALALGFAVGFACTSDSTFACAQDDDCSLGGVAGVCTVLGQCAYPDATCPSGYRYPVGAQGGLAEQCSDTSGASGGSTSDSSQSGSQSASSTTGSSTDSTSSNSGSTSAASSDPTVDPSTSADPTATTDPATTGDGSTGSTQNCEQELSEPNNSINTAAEFSPTCSFTLGGAAGGSDGEDWYDPDIDPNCEQLPTAVSIDAPGGSLEVCSILVCVGGVPSNQCDGENSIQGDTSICCGQDFTVTHSCPAQDAELYLLVEAEDAGGGGACVDYTVDVAVMQN